MKISRFAVYSIQCIFIPITTCTGIKNSTDLQQELTTFNNGQDFDGLEHFTYNNSGFVNLLFDHLSDTNFDGITVCYPYSNTAVLCPCLWGKCPLPYSFRYPILRNQYSSFHSKIIYPGLASKRTKIVGCHMNKLLYECQIVSCTG